MSEFLWGVYCVIGLGMSLFFAFCTPQIHFRSTWKKMYDYNEFLSKKNWPLRLAQWFLNFLGSALGWGAGAYIIWSKTSHLPVSLDFVDVTFVIIFFLGVTGYLPHFLVNKLSKIS